ncbi:pentapeptide repeat-containing protein [Nonomuraea typhae]|uniref:pentapeptide repeat-containing protein n=1 Tax=Nonomuraea typhae TaxID=2603600 RepID=UPI0012FC3106|nr:hypothetical protein [Nonomuraea typhae]
MGCVLERCDFTRAGFDYLAVFNSRFVDCVFRRTRITSSMWHRARFERCLFDRSRLTGVGDDVDFVDCVFTGRNKGLVFWGDEVTGNDFTEADLAGVSFDGVDFHTQRMPDRPDHALIDRAAERARTAHQIVGTWPEERHRRIAEHALESLVHRSREDGYALLVRSDLGYKLPPWRKQELFDALRGQANDQR